MKKLVFRLGEADPRATHRVLEYDLDGEAHHVVVEAKDNKIEIFVEEGVTVSDVMFYDKDDDGCESRPLEVLGSYVVSDKEPLLTASCLFDRVVDVPEDEIPKEIVDYVDDALPAPEIPEVYPPVKPEPAAPVKASEPEVLEEPAKPVSEAESIRQYLKANPDAENTEVIDALGEQGIEVNSSQVNRARKQLAG